MERVKRSSFKVIGKTVGIPCALIFLDKTRGEKDKILFIDASTLGESISKTQKILTANDIAKICKLYHDFQKNKRIKYNVKGFSWVAKISDIVKNGCKIMPSIYTGVEEKNINSTIIEKEIEELKMQLVKQIKISNGLSNSVLEEIEK